eukprot:Clim_evm41s33 gene=Clim_evmTU41s33
MADYEDLGLLSSDDDSVADGPAPVKQVNGGGDVTGIDVSRPIPQAEAEDMDSSDDDFAQIVQAKPPTKAPEPRPAPVPAQHVKPGRPHTNGSAKGGKPNGLEGPPTTSNGGYAREVTPDPLATYNKSPKNATSEAGFVVSYKLSCLAPGVVPQQPKKRTQSPVEAEKPKDMPQVKRSRPSPKQEDPGRDRDWFDDDDEEEEEEDYTAVRTNSRRKISTSSRSKSHAHEKPHSKHVNGTARRRVKATKSESSRSHHRRSESPRDPEPVEEVAVNPREDLYKRALLTGQELNDAAQKFESSTDKGRAYKKRMTSNTDDNAIGATWYFFKTAVLREFYAQSLLSGEDASLGYAEIKQSILHYESTSSWFNMILTGIDMSGPIVPKLAMLRRMRAVCGMRRVVLNENRLNRIANELNRLTDPNSTAPASTGSDGSTPDQISTVKTYSRDFVRSVQPMFSALEDWRVAEREYPLSKYTHAVNTFGRISLTSEANTVLAFANVALHIDCGVNGGTLR